MDTNQINIFCLTLPLKTLHVLYLTTRFELTGIVQPKSRPQISGQVFPPITSVFAEDPSGNTDTSIQPHYTIL